MDITTRIDSHRRAAPAVLGFLLTAALLAVLYSTRESTLRPAFPQRELQTWPSDGENLLACIVSRSAGARAVDASLYDDSRIGTNLRYDGYFPMLILNVTTVTDIQAAVVCAAEAKVNVVVMNGGHSFEGMSCTDGLLLHLDEFNAVLAAHQAGEEASVTVQSGIRLARLYGVVIDLFGATTSGQDTFVVGGGTCPTVGVTGHALCGGYGMLGRQVGLTSDQISKIQVVLADGTLVVATANNEYNDVFWALRGGCSSAFGVVAAVTFRLLRLPSPAVTIVDLPTLSYSAEDVEGTALWWQRWASVEAPVACTSTLTFTKEGLQIQAVYLGSKRDDLFMQTVKQIALGLQGLLSFDEVYSACHQGTFLDAVLWWSGDDDLTNLEDLLAVKSLDPLDSRSTSRRKSKSLVAARHLVPPDAVRALIDYKLSGDLNAIEWKAYGGSNLVGAGLYSDERSPLLRGHMLEMHYGNSYGGEGSPEEDEALVAAVNDIGASLSKYFTGSVGYIGYVDCDLANPGASYFGEANAVRLSEIARHRDPTGVLTTPASAYLYPVLAAPPAEVDLYVGSFSNVISHWKLRSDGSLTYISSAAAALRNPSWLVTAVHPGSKYVYAVNQVNDALPNETIALGAVSSYRVLPDGSLRLMNSVTSGGGSPNHASISSSQQHVYVANSCGSVSVHGIDTVTGAVEPTPVQVIPINEDIAAVKCCTSTSFLHQLYVHDNDVYVVDRDRDEVTHFKRNSQSGIISTNFEDKLLFEKGSGPRHLQFHPSGKYAFLISELANKLTVLRVDGSGGLHSMGVYSTLREGEAAVDMAAGEVQVSRDGVFVYGSNRDTSDPNLNRSSIVVFRFDAGTGILYALQHISSGGIHPRHFALFYVPEKRLRDYAVLMVVANKDSNSLVTFTADSRNGYLKPTGHIVSTQPYHDQPVYVGSTALS